MPNLSPDKSESDGGSRRIKGGPCYTPHEFMHRELHMLIENLIHQIETLGRVVKFSLSFRQKNKKTLDRGLKFSILQVFVKIVNCRKCQSYNLDSKLHFFESFMSQKQLNSQK